MADETKKMLEILGAICNGTLEADRETELNQLMRTSAEARQLYTDYLDVHLSLVQSIRQDAAFSLEESVELLELVSEVNQSDSGASSRIPPFRRKWRPSAWTTSFIAAATLLVSLVSGLFLVTIDEPVSTTAALVPDNRKAEVVESHFVAQVCNLTEDVVWGDRTTNHEFLLRLRRGDRVDISKGLVQLDYFAGAKMILHGPCVFVPTSENSGRLEQGHLTGEVSEGDFLLTTPTAKVIDLGTAFGVSVDGVTQTDVHVFDGEVRVTSDDLARDTSNSLLLKQGMSARVMRGRGIKALSNANLTQYVRALPAVFANEARSTLSLVDVLSGYSKAGYRLAGVIAPDTGKSDQHPWLRPDGPGYSVHKGYQATLWHPFVDGVFIPDSTGIGTLLDSAGHAVDLPPTTGRTWGPIWSRRRTSGTMAKASSSDYWGTDSLEDVISRLKNSETGMIGIHSNVGITFDLDAIRQQEGRQLKEFRGSVSNLDNSRRRWDGRNSSSEYSRWAKEGLFSADFRLYVDGELRASRLGFKRSDGEAVMTSGLSPEDRFLTLVSTDAGGAYPDAHDHVVLIDPVLVFSP